MNSSTVQRDTNSFKINSTLTLEWNDKNRQVDVHAEQENAVPVLKIDTGNAKGWVRLRFKTDQLVAGRIVGASMVFKLKETGSIKPYFLQVDSETGRHAEISGTAWKWITPKQENSWVDVSGAYHSEHLPERHNVELVIDLPSGNEIVVADIQIKSFVADKNTKEQQNIPITGVLHAIEAFQNRPVWRLAEHLKNPRLFGANFKLSNNKLEGWALIDSNQLYVCSADRKEHLSVPLDQPRIVSDRLSIPNCAFSQCFSQTPFVEVFAGAKDGDPIWSGSPLGQSKMERARKGEFPRIKQNDQVLIWAPISVAGLTVQLEQITSILKRQGIKFAISYHVAPRVDHPLREFWIEPREIDSPKMVLYLERFVPFDRGFDGAFKVFYMNLDWLSDASLSVAKIHADVVLCPTPYLLENLSSKMENSRVVHLPWPSQFDLSADATETANTTAAKDRKIRILYIGNDYDDLSRKHPVELIDAISRLKREDLVIDLKFRETLPPGVRQKLSRNPRVGKVLDYRIRPEEIEALYKNADLNIIPNACEGNGLSILESYSKGVVPAVLNGHPMTDVTNKADSFYIDCEQVGHQEKAPLYRATASQLHAFLEKLDVREIEEKKQAIKDLRPALSERQAQLENTLKTLISMSGIHSRDDRKKIQAAHIVKDAQGQLLPRNGERVKSLLFEDRGQKQWMRPVRLVDVVMTTSKRAWCLRETLDRVLQAMRASPFEHRLFLLIDAIDTSTMEIVTRYASDIEQVHWTNSRLGLPYLWNTGLDLVRNTVNRSERRPSYICYIQDDCLINDPNTYFAKMVGIASQAAPGFLGYVSGFHTEVHPGWADFEWNGEPVVASDSFDGKNFMATPEVLQSVGRLTWWFKDGQRRGNPGPKRGSHFDLWQWKESENSLGVQKRISLILPKLCTHLAKTADESTWNNDTTQEATEKRIKERKVYDTRRT